MGIAEFEAKGRLDGDSFVHAGDDEELSVGGDAFSASSRPVVAIIDGRIDRFVNRSGWIGV
jgi:hypothetical protein